VVAPQTIWTARGTAQLVPARPVGHLVGVLYESDRASRTRQAHRPLSQAQLPRGSPKPQPQALTPTPPYEVSRPRTGDRDPVVDRGELGGGRPRRRPGCSGRDRLGRPVEPPADWRWIS